MYKRKERTVSYKNLFRRLVGGAPHICGAQNSHLGWRLRDKVNGKNLFYIENSQTVTYTSSIELLVPWYIIGFTQGIPLRIPHLPILPSAIKLIGLLML